MDEVDMITAFVSALVAFFADRASKILILKYVFGLSAPVADKFGETVPLWKNVFHLTFVGNKGAAFGIFSGNKVLLVALCVLILVAMVGFMLKYKPKNALAKISLGMIMGGAVGNVLDRLLYGFVIDFLDFCLIDYPVFNVADCFIVIGGVLFCIYVIFLLLTTI